MAELKASRRKTQTAESVAVTDSDLQAIMLAAPVGSAAVCIGTLKPGVRLEGLTAGQFSLIDLLRAILDQTGPADVLISAWTVGIRDGEVAGWLLNHGKKIRSLRFLVHDRFPATEPAYCGRLVEVFGPEVFTLAKIHAKVLVVQNEKWNIVVRSSMNLNRNDQWEQFSLEDSRQLAEFYLAAERKMRETLGPGVHWHPRQVDDAHNKVKQAMRDDIAPLLLEWEKKEQAKRAALEAVEAAKKPIRIPNRKTFLEDEYRTLDAAQKLAMRNGKTGDIDKIGAQKYKIFEQIQLLAAAAKPSGRLTSAQAGPALVDAVIDAPRAVQWEIYQRLGELPGFADGDDNDNEEEPEERPPLRAVKGGKK